MKGDENDSIRVPSIYVELDTVNDKTGAIEVKTMICNYQELVDLQSKVKDALKQAQTTTTE